jgi:DNA-binding PadR family transcriptional regulator
LPATRTIRTGRGQGRSVPAASGGGAAVRPRGEVRRGGSTDGGPGLLPQRNLSLHYHILKLLVGSIFRTPDERLNVDDVLKATREWLIVTPFTRSSLRSGIRNLVRRRLLRTEDEDGRTYYRITEQGRRAFDQYRQAMVLWRVEKQMGERLRLFTVSEILRKKSQKEKDYIPDECFIDWPLRFQPVAHRFVGRRELRVYDAFEK